MHGFVVVALFAWIALSGFFQVPAPAVPDLTPAPVDFSQFFDRNNWEDFHATDLLPTSIPELIEDILTNDEEFIEATPSSARFEINVAARELTIYANNEVVYRFPVGVGSARYKTPIGGKRTLSKIIWNPWWLPPSSHWARNSRDTPPGPRNPLGKAKMPLGNAILLHGTNKPHTVGHARSHGCLRMKNEDVIEVAWWLQKYFSSQDDESLRQQYLSSWRGPKTIRLEHSIPLEIVYQRVGVSQDAIHLYPDIYYRGGDYWDELFRQLAAIGIHENDLDLDKLPANLLVTESVTIPIQDVLEDSEVRLAVVR